ncbi:uncharacterized protein CDV56_104277 [Aspergillus thermomutatus]|uniref:Uncharacterized protein n=1 Tax=Aspergillus thermomutatus TaxID=41047 RepID=A0A397G706_ASPTH|nr:uncharacterized protein CDV56_104277 [Aspergillus thermomutatus]RHZ46387.1 hypothetical protein CDV56_104277 [Aspergillus thermomutatus]
MSWRPTASPPTRTLAVKTLRYGVVGQFSTIKYSSIADGVVLLTVMSFTGAEMDTHRNGGLFTAPRPRPRSDMSQVADEDRAIPKDN